MSYLAFDLVIVDLGKSSCPYVGDQLVNNFSYVDQTVEEMLTLGNYFMWAGITTHSCLSRISALSNCRASNRNFEREFFLRGS